ncbi:hypothetical protein [Brevibacterium siliguriense]|uniref:hypothetical protein n=1 Tax=Brevibacterium siliguriense TaxID=1136497 RepID=UPI001E2E12A7|nr:hypothetical protein [Brevibacterium siliguriense]
MARWLGFAFAEAVLGPAFAPEYPQAERRPAPATAAPLSSVERRTERLGGAVTSETVAG